MTPGMDPDGLIGREAGQGEHSNPGEHSHPLQRTERVEEMKGAERVEKMKGHKAEEVGGRRRCVAHLCSRKVYIGKNVWSGRFYDSITGEQAHSRLQH
jgi:hypothetical protein